MSFSLAQRKELKETSTLSKAFPYMGRMQFEIAETADFKGFGIARKACALKGERWVLSTTLDAGRLGAGRLNAGRFGCGSSIVLIIYAIVKTPGV